MEIKNKVLGMKYWAVCSLFFALVAGLTSCDVHQFPEPPVNIGPDEPELPEDPDYPDDPDQYVDLNLDLEYFTDMYLWEHYYDPKTARVEQQYPDANVDGNHPGTTDINEGKLAEGFKLATARISRKGSTDSYIRLEEFMHGLDEGYDMTLPIRIMPGEYDITVWSDLKEADEHPRFYDPSAFHSIKIDYDNYKANSDYRDAYRGRASINLGEEGGSFTIPMYRPMAKYEFVTTDLSEFLDKETQIRGLSTRATMDDYKVKIYYSTYHPSSYNAVEDWLENSTTGVNFDTNVTITGESEASLGFDYVFINDIDDGAVQATIVVYDLQGNQVTQSNQITVPLRRNHHTLLRGAFLTMDGSGGVGIDPGFNGDHNVIPR